MKTPLISLLPLLAAPAWAADTHSSSLDQAVASLLVAPASSAQPTPSPRLMDAALVLNAAAGCSNQTDTTEAMLQSGAHDPKKCGFSLQSTELSLSGAVDPYFSMNANVLYSDEHVELEEAFATTSSLPWGLQIKGGYFLSPFGAINASHPHNWAWMDQPVIASRILGSDGTRGAGASISWMLPGSTESRLIIGAQNADDDSMSSFLGAGHHGEEEHDHAADEAETGMGGAPVVEREVSGGRDLLWHGRMETTGTLGSSSQWRFGLSGMYGPNSSGNNASTRILGADLRLKWLPGNNFRGAPAVLWDSEWMQRYYAVAAYQSEAGDVPGNTLKDSGYYTQLQYRFHPQWAAGLRYEHASGSGEQPGQPRSADWQRNDRTRISPLLTWAPTHFSRLRLQYNHDDADSLSGRAHTVWLGVEFLIESHPAHE